MQKIIYCKTLLPSLSVRHLLGSQVIFSHRKSARHAAPWERLQGEVFVYSCLFVFIMVIFLILVIVFRCFRPYQDFSPKPYPEL